jgi:tetratricopeptide (TPR) repeat protein
MTKAKVLLAAAVLVSAAIVAVLIGWAPPLGRIFRGAGSGGVAYTGPFQNVDRSVQYVPEQRCTKCHADKARSFSKHPMGRSLMPVAATTVPPLDKSHHNPFTAMGSEWLVRLERTQLWQRLWQRRARPTKTGKSASVNGRPAAEQEWEVGYVLGSGAHGYAYLTDRGGFLYETPISWYSDKKIWDLSPGFDAGFRLTGRGIAPACLFCHANGARHVAGTVNCYEEPVFNGYAIGCQRCHGPGELHVARRTGDEGDLRSAVSAGSGDPRRARDSGAGRGSPDPGQSEVDYTIVNPHYLEPALREAVCEQCHLQGKIRVLQRGRDMYAFRPGLPADQFWSVFVPAPDARAPKKAVGHVEQMHESRCFRASEGPGQLGCISCHDPHEHVPAAARAAYYEERCLRCHQADGNAQVGPHGGGAAAVSAPACRMVPEERRRRPGASCIDCHMPRYGPFDIPHAASTDHRILRFGKSTEKEALPADDDGFPLLPFYSRKETMDDDLQRDRAVALVELARGLDPSVTASLPRLRATLDAAVQRHPDDFDAAEARGFAHAIQGHWAEGLAAFEQVLAKEPDREYALSGAGWMAEMVRQPKAAENYWRRAGRVNPTEPDYFRRLTLLLIKREAWTEAAPESEAWVQLDPFSVDAHVARLQCLLGAGNQKEAKAEFARVEALGPTNLRELQIKFEKKLR